jgi:hypothetical protein
VNRVGVVDDEPLGTPAGQARARGRCVAEALLGVGVLLFAAVVFLPLDGPALLEPRVGDQVSHVHHVAGRQLLVVARGDVLHPGLAAGAPLPGGPEDGGQHRLRGAGRHVDQEPGDLALGHGLKVFAHHLHAPAGDERGRGVEDVPRLFDELEQGQLTLGAHGVVAHLGHEFFGVHFAVVYTLLSRFVLGVFTRRYGILIGGVGCGAGGQRRRPRGSIQNETPLAMGTSLPQQHISSISHGMATIASLPHLENPHIGTSHNGNSPCHGPYSAKSHPTTGPLAMGATHSPLVMGVTRRPCHG